MMLYPADSILCCLVIYIRRTPVRCSACLTSTRSATHSAQPRRQRVSWLAERVPPPPPLSQRSEIIIIYDLDTVKAIRYVYVRTRVIHNETKSSFSSRQLFLLVVFSFLARRCSSTAVCIGEDDELDARALLCEDVRMHAALLCTYMTLRYDDFLLKNPDCLPGFVVIVLLFCNTQKQQQAVVRV